MNTQVKWENQAKTVIRYTYSGDWNWDGFYKVFADCQPSALDQRLCVLIDLRAVTRIPGDAILHLKRAAQLADGNSGLVIVIATSTSAIMLFNLFIMTYKSVSKKFRLVANDAEAYTLLQMPS